MALAADSALSRLLASQAACFSTSLRTTSKGRLESPQGESTQVPRPRTICCGRGGIDWRHSRRQFELDEQGLCSVQTLSACSETAIVPATGGTNKSESIERGSTGSSSFKFLTRRLGALAGPGTGSLRCSLPSRPALRTHDACCFSSGVFTHAARTYAAHHRTIRRSRY